jgi:pimeloyl-ACP methyl ester carboxylesterase
MDVARIAQIVVDVMAQRGYPRFAARGSDLGAGVLQQPALAHPERLIALHLSGTNPYLASVPDDLSKAEKGVRRRRRAVEPDRDGLCHGARLQPQTLAHASTTPRPGWLPGVLEKFRSWSDCGGDLDAVYDRDDLPHLPVERGGVVMAGRRFVNSPVAGYHHGVGRGQ